MARALETGNLGSDSDKCVKNARKAEVVNDTAGCELANAKARGRPDTGQSDRRFRQLESRGVAMSVEERLERIEQMLSTLVERQTIKDWYTTAEVGGILGRAEYTVREWCRQGRLRAKKKPCGRGKGGEWLVSHEELTRLKNEGLLPFRPAA